MRNSCRIGFVFALAVLGNGVGVYAQSRGLYNRVTTTRREVIRSSATTSAMRGGVQRTDAGGFRSELDADALRPYAARALAEAEGSLPRAPAGSGWEQEPVGHASPPPARLRSRTYTYFPGLRPGLAVQQPVTLTATIFTGRSMCTHSRASVMGGAGTHR